MLPLPVVYDIRTARCSVPDPAAFLRELRAVASETDTRIICFNADMIAGRIHALTAVKMAMRAYDEGLAISNTLEMECLLFAAGSRQCNVAASFGIHQGDNRLYVCCLPARGDTWTALEKLFCFVREDWDTMDPEKQRRLAETFGISPGEIAAAGGGGRITDLVLERVVLLQVMR